MPSFGLPIDRSAIYLEYPLIVSRPIGDPTQSRLAGYLPVGVRERRCGAATDICSAVPVHSTRNRTNIIFLPNPARNDFEAKLAASFLAPVAPGKPIVLKIDKFQPGHSPLVWVGLFATRNKTRRD
jgi:hypothetical protein